MTVPGRATVIAWLVVTAVAFGYASGAAHAQGFAYRAEPPTNGALYRDGQTGRYLLGGIWLYRSDLGDIGLDDGWWRPLATTAGWSPVSVPNAYNVGDLSSASMSGTGSVLTSAPMSRSNWT